MVASTYDAALRHVLVHEGGYSNHPSDPGGATNFGITLADYRRYAKPNATAADVRAMRLDEARTIYRQHYWNALGCDELPAGLDYAVFDYGINSGVGRAGRVLRHLVGISGEGPVDAALFAAVRRANAHDLIARLCEERLSFLKRLKTWPVFGAGWGRRVAEVKAAALVMTAAPVAAQESTAMRHAAAGGVAAAGAAAAQQAHQAGARPVVVAAIALATAALLVCFWLAYRWRRQQNAS